MIKRIASHLGLSIIIIGGVLSQSALQEKTLELHKGIPEQQTWEFSQAAGANHALPFAVQLEEFTTDFYYDGITPKQYTSRIRITDICQVPAADHTRAQEEGAGLTTSVNHPCFYKGWVIYQTGFDEENPNVSTLKAVRNPWLPLLLLGIGLLAAGSALSLGGIWNSKSPLVAVTALAALFFLASTAGLNLGTPPPALRSIWFLPHIIIYMLAYAALALSLILAVIALRKEGNYADFSLKLLRTCAPLLALGMLCGALWARQVWGTLWSWDPKECWAAVTWLLTLLPLHLQKYLQNRKELYALLVLLAFLSVQMTWWGVNFLPSADGSLHAYSLLPK